MPNKGMEKKKKNVTNSGNRMDKNMGYNNGGMMPNAPMSAMYRAGGKLYMGGGKTMMMDKTMSNKDDVQKRFGGGGMTEPSMKKNK